MKNLTLRLISGIIFISIVIGSIIISPYSFVAVFAVITALAVREFHTLTNNKEAAIQVNLPTAMLGGGILFICSYFHSIDFTAFPFTTFTDFMSLHFLSLSFSEKNKIQYKTGRILY
ncbi:MAG: phosphatidate cytidylyltransferase [Paludibacteraceae bacterium]